MKDKKKYLVIFLIGLLLITGFSFAYVRITVSGKKTNLLSAGTLILNLVEDENNIELVNAIPTKTEVGKSFEPFTFSLKNEGTEDSYYTVYLIDETLDNESMRLEDKYVDYYLTRTYEGETTEEINVLTYFDTELIMVNGNQVTGRVLDTGLITTTGKQIDYSLRLWLDYDADNSVMGKEFAVKLYVIADQVKEKLVINSDGTGANVPEVASGMIPVVYDDSLGSWVKADVTNTNKSWFDYGTQKWANVVTVVENGTQSRLHYESAPVGTPISMADINTMWVWIPRYSYTIKAEDGVNFYGKGSTNRTLPGEIDIQFIPIHQKDNGNGQYTGSTASNYLTMPGFTFGTEELYGVWVGKFETAGGSGNATTAESVLIKPDVQSWRSIQVSKMYQVGRDLQNQESIFGFSNATNDLDSHMMKNTEWSLVAFLSQSKYGKYGNSSYTGAEKEVFINNSSSYYTGRSGGSYGGNTPINGTYTSQSDTTQYKNYGFYSYDDYLLDYSTGAKTTKVAGKGTGASTTGNIYGVYDMSGGAWEYVMANHQNYSGYTARNYTAEEALTALNRTDGAAGIWNSGFNGPVFGKDYNEETGAWDIPMSITNGIDFPESKYYDLYKTTSHLTACNGGPCKGQSYETSSWYGDSWWFGALSYPWVGRGGNYTYGSGAGVFRFYAGGGFAYSNDSFRLVLVVSDE